MIIKAKRSVVFSNNRSLSLFLLLISLVFSGWEVIV